MTSGCRCPSRHVSGMTLVEVLIALAIAALMTLTGWRAIDALQTSRDRIVSDAAQWHALDDFFVTLEADLRRAELDEFAGNDNALAFLLAPQGDNLSPQAVRYRLVAQTTNNAAQQHWAVVRETGGQAIALTLVNALQFSYTSDGQQFSNDVGEYPRALRIQLQPYVAGTSLNNAATPVERLLALR